LRRRPCPLSQESLRQTSTPPVHLTRALRSGLYPFFALAYAFRHPEPTAAGGICFSGQPRKSSPPARFPLHQRKTMPRKAHPWGAPPWTVDFCPTPRALPDHVDFAIVGGGFSGLSAAAWLRRLAPGRSVLVLESASLGDGASGRTGGMALSETAAGQLPGLGEVLAGYKKILDALRIDSRLTLPGVWELSRSGPAKKHSPICWSDSGDLQIVRRVPGGTVTPGKV